MLKIREAIAVEGRYDKNTLSQVVDTLILETHGFGIFKDPERMALLRRAAEKRGSSSSPTRTGRASSSGTALRAPFRAST